jgi:hypothetical protein
VSELTFSLLSVKRRNRRRRVFHCAIRQMAEKPRSPSHDETLVVSHRFSGTNRVFADTIEVSAEEIGVNKKTGSEIAGGGIAAQGTLRSAQ